MKIGIVASSGGGVFQELLGILPASKYQFHVVTDRVCGIEKICSEKNVPFSRIIEPDNERFSFSAREIFLKAGGVDLIFLFFTRLVTQDLFNSAPTFNIHPSLLPAFKGFNPVQRALEARVKFLGATLHLVDSSVDGGPVMAQVVSPISSLKKPDRIEKLSFVQKVYLALVGIELIEKQIVSMSGGEVIIDSTRNLPFTNNANPALTKASFKKHFLELRRRSDFSSVFI